MADSSLKTRIQDDVKDAMRSKDKDRLGTLRLITAAIKQKEVDERIEMDDAAVISVILARRANQSLACLTWLNIKRYRVLTWPSRACNQGAIINYPVILSAILAY